MEAKGRDRDEHEEKGGAKEDSSAVQRAPSKNIVIRFTEFASKVLNQDMDDFFEDHMEDFDQLDEELTSGAGETLEQYEVYQKYIAQLEKHFDGFAAQEGFDSVMDCFNALQEMVIEDKRERESALREMARRMKEIQEEWQRNMLANAQGGDDSKAEGKTDGSESKGGGSTRGESKGDNDDDAKADSKHSEDDESDMERHQSGPPPAIMFFQPVSMDSLLSHVLSMTEYTTFSTIMRTKVRQAKLLRVLERRVENHKEDAEDRDEQLKDNSIKGAVDVFEQLVERVCGLTPHQEALKEQVRSQVSVSDWSEMLESAKENAFSAKYQQVFKRLVMSVCMAIWNMVSLAAQQRVRLELCRFLPMIDQLESLEDVVAAAIGFLKIGHSLVDETEVNMMEVLQAHSHHHRKRKSKEAWGNSDGDAK